MAGNVLNAKYVLKAEHNLFNLMRYSKLVV